MARNTNDKFNSRWQRHNTIQHKTSKADRILDDATRKLVKDMEARTNITRAQIKESWDIGSGPSLGCYTFVRPGRPGMRGPKVEEIIIDEVSTGERKRYTFKFDIDPESVAKMRESAKKIEALIERKLQEGLARLYEVQGVEIPKPKYGVEIMIDGKWVPTEEI